MTIKIDPSGPKQTKWHEYALRFVAGGVITVSLLFIARTGKDGSGDPEGNLAVVPFVTAMRLWSVHPSVLDRVGLVALWREGLLAQKVLLGQTKGYRFHPQLERFRASNDPVTAISTYLWGIVDEARARGYQFDASKIATRKGAVLFSVTQGQLDYERVHLSKKLRVRDPAKLRELRTVRLKPHPMLRVVSGGIESWEVVSGSDGFRELRKPTSRRLPADR